MRQVRRLMDWFDENSMESFRHLAEQFFFVCRMRNLTPKTLTIYAERLEYLARYLAERGVQVTDVTRKDILDYVGSIIEKVSNETVNGRIRVYKRFWNVLVEEGLWEAPNPMERVQYIRTEKRLRPVISIDQFETLLSLCNKRTFVGYRNSVMMLLLFDGMLRVGEVRCLRTADTDLREGIVRVTGKGRRQREVPIGLHTAKAIHFWLNKYRRQCPGDTLLCKRDGTPLSKDRVEKIIRRISDKAGFKVYPHLLRHSGASLWVKQGGNSFTLQRILGHSSITTTERYVSLDPTSLKEAHNQFSPSRELRV